MARYLRLVTVVLASGLALAAGSARADRCTADAEFLHSYPANQDKTKFKFKFRVSSDDCTRYGCTGYVHYRIHFDYKSGSSNGKSTLVSYRIPAGQKSREITDETYPSGVSSGIAVRDVEIGEVSCRTP